MSLDRFGQIYNAPFKRCVPVMATGVFLKLNKRDCKMRIRLTPYDCDFLRVHWRIGGDNYYFFPSCVMGSQFSAFITAVYRLYEEENIRHTYWPRKHLHFNHEYPCERQDKKHYLQSTVYWDEEGFGHQITFSRYCNDDKVFERSEPDPVSIHIRSGRRFRNYTVDGRDLCYAIARGCTEAIKKYGFTGYRESTGMQYPGDTFDIHELLFIKAYALDSLDVRKMRMLWKKPNGWAKAAASAFEKELELLLFDM